MGSESKPAPALQPGPGPGVRSLLQGNHCATTEKAETPAPQSLKAVPAIPAWFFFGVDLLLLAMAVGVAWPNPSALSWKSQLLCAVLIALGGSTAVFGVLKTRD